MSTKNEKIWNQTVHGKRDASYISRGRVLEEFYYLLKGLYDAKTHDRVCDKIKKRIKLTTIEELLCRIEKGGNLDELATELDMRKLTNNSNRLSLRLRRGFKFTAYLF